MRYLIAAHTDVGIKKKTNQDSYMIKEAQTKMGRIFFGVLCDGMGGLSNGELASATVIRAMEQWFETDFPQLLVHTTDAEEVLEKVKNDWHVIANELNVQLARYVEGTGNRMGTTIVTLLLIKNQYFIMNVGDSRAYALSNQVYQLTKDQSLVQQQIDLGLVRPEDAERHPQRNVLLQCIGASQEVLPDFYRGTVFPGSLFLLCSDGFRHEISEQELYMQLQPSVLTTEEMMKERLVYLTELELICTGLNNNINIEVLLTDFAERSGLDDVMSFANVFEVCNRQGGDLKRVVNQTRDVISDKMEIEMEIDTMVAGNKNELNVMMVMPLLIVGMMKGMGISSIGTNTPANVVIKVICIGIFGLAYVMGSRITDIKI